MAICDLNIIWNKLSAQKITMMMTSCLSHCIVVDRWQNTCMKFQISNGKNEEFFQLIVSLLFTIRLFFLNTCNKKKLRYNNLHKKVRRKLFWFHFWPPPLGLGIRYYLYDNQLAVIELLNQMLNVICNHHHVDCGASEQWCSGKPENRKQNH